MNDRTAITGVVLAGVVLVAGRVALEQLGVGAALRHASAALSVSNASHP